MPRKKKKTLQALKEIGEEYGRELPVLEIRSMIEIRVNPKIKERFKKWRSKTGPWKYKISKAPPPPSLVAQ